MSKHAEVLEDSISFLFAWPLYHSVKQENDCSLKIFIKGELTLHNHQVGPLLSFCPIYKICVLLWYFQSCFTLVIILLYLI
jgi:hypothetical protein